MGSLFAVYGGKLETQPIRYMVEIQCACLVLCEFVVDVSRNYVSESMKEGGRIIIISKVLGVYVVLAIVFKQLVHVSDDLMCVLSLLVHD